MFPLAANRVSGPQWSECARGGAAVKARRGDALLFYRYMVDLCPETFSSVATTAEGFLRCITVSVPWSCAEVHLQGSVRHIGLHAQCGSCQLSCS